MSDAAIPPRQSWLTTLGWAAYLACSWTWCIGMFLPVLLVRDFGIWGFVVFAVPNVVGAASVGWVLRHRGQSEAVRERHKTACAWFSWVTISFQLFFAAWAMTTLMPPEQRVSAANAWPMAVVIILMVLAVLALDPGGMLAKSGNIARSCRWVWTPLAFWAACVVVMILMAMLGGVRPPSQAMMRGPLERGLPALAPVCAFGFLLCPFLDVTLLRARAQTSGRFGTWAFSIGFCLMFPVMILFTLSYAHVFDHWPKLSMKAPRAVQDLLVGYILAQLLYTGALHFVHNTRALGVDRGFSAGAATRLIFPAGIVMSVPFLLLPAAFLAFDYRGLTGPEVVYRLFMSFYGLVFPAYVWLCMIPVRGEVGTQAPTRAKLNVLAVAVTLAAPCYWMGFIERETWWLGPGLFIVLAARVFVPRGTRKATLGAQCVEELPPPNPLPQGGGVEPVGACSA